MISTQLRAFSASSCQRLGSVDKAAVELEVAEAAVSLHIGRPRRELEDRLSTPAAVGLALTPGGLRLASRATELLGLRCRAVREVSQAGRGRRLTRIAASGPCAGTRARAGSSCPLAPPGQASDVARCPGLLELFASRADDLDVELSVHHAYAPERCSRRARSTWR